MKKIALPFILSAVAATLALGGCATYNPNVVQGYQAGRMGLVQDATVISVRPVTIDGQQSGLGGVAGAVIGGTVGGNRGSYNASAVGTVVGAVAGAVIGNAIERGATQANGVELVLQMRNGERRSVVQGVSEPLFQPGDAVIVTTTGGRTTVQHASPVQATSTPAPVETPAK